MKTIETRQINSEGYLILPIEFTAKTFKYKQIERSGDFAIYTQTDKYGNVYYLPMIIQKFEEYEIAGNVMPKTEKIVRDEEWGRLAYTCPSLPAAQKRLDHLKKYIKKLETIRNNEK